MFSSVNDAMKKLHENRLSEARDSVAENMPKFIYDLGDSAWSAQEPRKTLGGKIIYTVTKNGPATISNEEMIEKVLNRFKNLKLVDGWRTDGDQLSFTKKESNVVTEDEEVDEKQKRKDYHDRTDKRMNEFKQNLDLNPLFDWLREVTGINDLKFEVDRKQDNRIYWSSQNIVDKVGVMKFAFSEVVIESFSNGIATTAPDYYSSEKIDYDKDYDLYYWVSIHFAYRAKGGGTNGVDLASAQYKDGKWKFDIED